MWRCEEVELLPLVGIGPMRVNKWKLIQGVMEILWVWCLCDLRLNNLGWTCTFSKGSGLEPEGDLALTLEGWNTFHQLGMASPVYCSSRESPFHTAYLPQTVLLPAMSALKFKHKACWGNWASRKWPAKLSLGVTGNAEWSFPCGTVSSIHQGDRSRHELDPARRPSYKEGWLTNWSTRCGNPRLYMHVCVTSHHAAMWLKKQKTGEVMQMMGLILGIAGVFVSHDCSKTVQRHFDHQSCSSKKECNCFKPAEQIYAVLCGWSP